MKTLDVVIVNWNAGGLLRRTVQSLARSNRETYEFGRIVIVDNASEDDSLAWLDVETGSTPSDQTSKARLSGPLPVDVICNASNRGFAAACNQGAEDSTADYLLFLNPDTEVERSALDVAVATMGAKPEVGVLGIQLVNSDGDPKLSCSRFPTPSRFLWKALGLDRVAPSIFPPHYLTEFDHRTSRYVDQVMGAFFFTRRELFEELGGFDERFFVYFEEVDYCYRLAVKGRKTYFLSESRSYHQGGGTTETVRSTRLYYSLRSRLAYGYKHFGRMGAHFQTVSTLTVEFFARLVYALADGSPSEVLEGYRLLWRDLSSLLRAPYSVRRSETFFTTQKSA